MLTVILSIWTVACTLVTDEPVRSDNPSLPDAAEPVYTWDHFFNQGCGPVTDIIASRDGDAAFVYYCSDGREVTQYAKRHTVNGRVQLWSASPLSSDELIILSNSKCQASSMYLGAEHLTIQFACSLVHLTVGYNIIDWRSVGKSTRIKIEPTRVLIINPDGVQEFEVENGRLNPVTPVTPFRNSTPCFTFRTIKNLEILDFHFRTIEIRRN